MQKHINPAYIHGLNVSSFAINQGEINDTLTNNDSLKELLLSTLDVESNIEVYYTLERLRDIALDLLTNDISYNDHVAVVAAWHILANKLMLGNGYPSEDNDMNELLTFINHFI